jgi:hypothetical protein
VVEAMRRVLVCSERELQVFFLFAKLCNVVPLNSHTVQRSLEFASPYLMDLFTPEFPPTPLLSLLSSTASMQGAWRLF